MKDVLLIPDIEVIVGSSGNDVAVFCFYQREDIHQGYEVVSAVTSKDTVAVVRQVLQDAITALNTADWHNVDELREDAVEEVEDPPF